MTLTRRRSLIPYDQLLFSYAETAHFFLSPLSKSSDTSDCGRPVYIGEDGILGLSLRRGRGAGSLE